MLNGLSALELGRLRISVGYGTHKKGRPLSPIEVAELIHRAHESGSSLNECASEIRLDKTGVGKFLKLLDLPENLQHQVDWGKGKSFLGFSCAVELVRIPNQRTLQVVAKAVLEHGLTTKETRQVVQLLHRSKRHPQEVLYEVVGMRPTIERKHVFIGTITVESILSDLSKLTQGDKNSLLKRAMLRLNLANTTGRLGDKHFTIVGDDQFGKHISKVGMEKLENLLSNEIAKQLNETTFG